MIFVAASDASYLHQLKSLLGSVAVNYPKVMFVARLLDCDIDDSELLSIYENTKIIHHSTDVCKKKKNIYMGCNFTYNR